MTSTDKMRLKGFALRVQRALLPLPLPLRQRQRQRRRHPPDAELVRYQSPIRAQTRTCGTHMSVAGPLNPYPPLHQANNRCWPPVMRLLAKSCHRVVG